MSRPARLRALRRALRLRRGYSLVELLVAVLITSLVVGSLYRVSRAATETFNQQQRIAEMQLRLRFATEQLRADLSRAGYMATPNSAVDVRVCPRPTHVVQGIGIARDTLTPVPLPSDNRFIAPAVVRLTGNFHSVDEYLVAGINGTQISLQNQTPQWGRVTPEEFQRIFIGASGQRRLLRVTSPTGQSQFVQVVGGQYQPTNAASLPTLTVNPAPTQIGQGAGGGTAGAGCGVSGLGVGASVAPVSMVEYRLANVQSVMPDLYPTDPATAGRKTDLIRQEYELQPNPMVVPSGLRVVGEYAVDFDVTVSLDDGFPAGSLTGPVAIRTLPFGDTQIDQIVGDVQSAGPGTARPQRVRSVTFRLSMREREQDPAFGWVQRASAGDPLGRFRVFDNRIGAARVRTVTTEVALPNLALRNLR